jgi:mannose-6-phosphate isomerase
MAEAHLTQALVFEPIFMERVWGGRRLESFYGKRLPPAVPIGESWEIVDRPEAQSVVHNGPFRGATLHELWLEHREEIFGQVRDSLRFPLLVKLLDSQENLSVQVHPPKAVAPRLDGESKTEFWYITNAAPNARVYAGVSKGVTRESFLKALDHGSVEEQLHAIEVATGDGVFLPSGRIHALGAGNVLVEIQENSDTTYRIYDWAREKEGPSGRQMRIAEAMQCVDFDDVEPPLSRPRGETLESNEFFDVRKWELTAARDVAPPGEFAIVVCLTGGIECTGMRFKPGNFFLVPALATNRELKPAETGTTLLRITIPRLDA